MFVFGVILVVLGTVLVTYDASVTRFYETRWMLAGVVLVVAGVTAMTAPLF